MKNLIFVFTILTASLAQAQFIDIPLEAVDAKILCSVGTSGALAINLETQKMWQTDGGDALGIPLENVIVTEVSGKIQVTATLLGAAEMSLLMSEDKTSATLTVSAEEETPYVVQMTCRAL